MDRNQAETKKSRVRRTDWRRDDSGIRASLHNVLETKSITRNPTRFVPDVHGFSGLQKVEIKNDKRDIERENIFVTYFENENDDVCESANVTSKPTCSRDSVLLNKRKRIVGWAEDPRLVDSEIENLEQTVKNSKEKFGELCKDEEKWHQNFEFSRLNILKGLQSSRNEVTRLKQENQLLLDSSIAKCTQNQVVRTRRQYDIKDVFEEFYHRQNIIDEKIHEYESLVHTATLESLPSSSEEPGLILVPIITVSIDELDYACDRDVLRGSAGSQSRIKFPSSKAISTGHATEFAGNTISSTSAVTSLATIYCGDKESETLSTADIFHPDMSSSSESDLKGGMSTRHKEGPSKKGPGAINSKNKPNLQPYKEYSNDYFLDLKSESDWLNYANELSLKLNSSTKMTRRSQSQINSNASTVIPMSTYVKHRTPRGIRLILNPLSQFEDKYAGTCGESVRDSSWNSEIQAEEDLVLEKFRLQSDAVIAESKLLKIQSAINEWSKLSRASKNLSTEQELRYNFVANEELKDRKKMRKDLVMAGICIPNEGDRLLENENEVVEDISKSKPISKNGGAKHFGTRIRVKRSFKNALSNFTHVNQNQGLVHSLSSSSSTVNSAPIT